jgi:hypothetical protein
MGVLTREPAVGSRCSPVTTSYSRDNALGADFMAEYGYGEDAVMEEVFSC